MGVFALEIAPSHTHDTCFCSGTYFEAPCPFLIRPGQVDAARIAAKTLLMVMTVLELGRGLRLRARVEEGAGCFHSHRVDGAVDNLRTRVTTAPITTETQNNSPPSATGRWMNDYDNQWRSSNSINSKGGRQGVRIVVVPQR